MRALKLLMAAALLWTGVAHAQLELGKDYQMVESPQAVDDPTRIEVTEFFWYGCPHCMHLEKKLNAWLARQGNKIVFKRVPVTWGSGHEKHAQVFYTLDVLGQIPRLHGRVFEAVQGGETSPQRVELRDEGKFVDWAAKQGLDKAKVQAAYRSFGVMSQLQRAKQLTGAYGVSGVPAFYVQGKYMTSPSLTQDEDRFFKALDELIAQEQAKLKPAAKKVAAPVKK